MTIHLRATGDAPILKQNKFKLRASSNFATLIELLRKQLRFKDTDSLVRIRSKLFDSRLLACLLQFLFVNSAFSPSPEELLYDVYECFKTENELVINYATADAYG